MTKEALKLAQEPVLDIDGHVVGKMRKPKPAQEPVSFPCCGYTDAIKWNHGVVQCHMCGQVYTVAQEPHGYDWSMLEAAQESLREHMARIKELESQLAQPAQEPVKCLDCGSHNVGVPANYDSLVDSVKAQPVQEPVARVTGVYGGRFTYEPINPAMVLPIGMALYAGPA